jgi:hypothetical protein
MDFGPAAQRGNWWTVHCVHVRRISEVISSVGTRLFHFSSVHVVCSMLADGRLLRSVPPTQAIHKHRARLTRNYSKISLKQLLPARCDARGV